MVKWTGWQRKLADSNSVLQYLRIVVCDYCLSEAPPDKPIRALIQQRSGRNKHRRLQSAREKVPERSAREKASGLCTVPESTVESTAESTVESVAESVAGKRGHGLVAVFFALFIFSLAYSFCVRTCGTQWESPVKKLNERTKQKTQRAARLVRLVQKFWFKTFRH